MTSANESAATGYTSPFTQGQDAEDLGRLVREVRAMKDVSVAELARRSGVTPDDVLEFEAGRLVPAEPHFATHMQALGFSV